MGPFVVATISIRLSLRGAETLVLGFWAVLCPCEKWPPQNVSKTAEECLRSAALLVELVSVTKRMTIMSLHQEAQLGRHAFESCLTLTSIIFVVDHTNKPRALPEGAFCGAGIEQLCLPDDFHNIRPRA